MDAIAREISTLRAAVRAQRRGIFHRRRMRLDELEARLTALETLVRVLYRVAPGLRP